MSIKMTSEFEIEQSRVEVAPLALDSGALGGWRKRTFDIVFGMTALVLLLPLFFFVAVAVKAYDRGPMFFRHRRVGVSQSQFPCLKFRTMRQDSDAALAAYLRDNVEAQREWIQTRKLKDDPRVTPIGVFLRKTSLDELPQIINIISGQMSVVGPRPIVADEVALYGSDARSYFATRPGLTGLWQVSGRSDTTYDERVRLDKSYVENWSLITDMTIILRTIPAVFMSRGSY